jgi:hypothetical protein
VEQAADHYLTTPPQPPSANFDFVYAAAPAELLEQRKAATAAAEGTA